MATEHIDENGAIKKILYCDLDGVIVDYDKFKHLTDDQKRLPGFFENLPPIPGAIDAFRELCDMYDVYILSTAPWSNPHAWSEKRLWVEKHLGELAFTSLLPSAYVTM